MKRMLLCLILPVSLALSASAEDVSKAVLVAKGKALAQKNCISCHAIEAKGASALAAAPPFRDIALRYDASELQDSFNEGVATDHTIMPDWEMTPEQAEALAAYVMTLAPYGVLKSEITP